MNITTIPEGVYCDALPTGEWACGIPERNIVRTHLGDLAMPVDVQGDPSGAPKLMFIRVTNAAGVFRIAAKSWSGDFIWVWQNGVWRKDPRNSHGVQGHGWSPDGSLAVMRGGGAQESQGLRYFDPAAGPDSNLDITGQTRGWVTGSPSYSPFSLFAKRKGVTWIYEWTDLGDDIFVGQGEEGACVVQHPTLGHRVLHHDAARFIQAHRQGNEIAVAFSVLHRDPAQQRGIIVRLTVAELATLPVYVPPPEKPPVIEEPPAVFTPEAPDRTDLVEQARQRWPDAWKHAHSGDARSSEFIQLCGRLMYEADERFGLNGKRGTETLSEDAVAWKNPAAPHGCEVIDIIVGAGGSNPKPGWHNVTDPNGGDGAKWIYPQPFDTEPPIDPPVDPPVTVDYSRHLAAITELLNALFKRVQRVEDELVGIRERNEQLTTLTDQRILAAKAELLAKVGAVKGCRFR